MICSGSVGSVIAVRLPTCLHHLRGQSLPLLCPYASIDDVRLPLASLFDEPSPAIALVLVASAPLVQAIAALKMVKLTATETNLRAGSVCWVKGSPQSAKDAYEASPGHA